jgi:hypothetical protein
MVAVDLFNSNHRLDHSDHLDGQPGRVAAKPVRSRMTRLRMRGIGKNAIFL